MSHSLLRPLIRKHVITILLVSFLGFLPGCQDLEGYKEDRPAQIRVQGTLTRVAAIGGVTTGWGIELDTPLEVGKHTVNLLEINHELSRWTRFEDKHVEAVGILEMRKGLERSLWPVFNVESMKEIPDAGALG
ncbi:MAG: hypothetical protein V3R60_00445 [Acidobacteriota bacterium]